jgi:hypothetical protein
LVRLGDWDGGFAASTSIVAPQRRHKAGISEGAIEVRFSQFANELFRNALSLL